MFKIIVMIFLVTSFYIYPKAVTVVNEDGTVKHEELSPEQKKAMENMNKDIQYFHEKIRGLISYVVKNKKHLIKDGNFIKNEIAYTEHGADFGSSYVVNVDTFITLNGDKVDSIKFSQRKGTIHPKADPAVFNREVENKFDATGVKTIQFRVFHYPLAYGENNPVEIYDVENIPDAQERIKMVRFYKENTRKLLRELENMIEHDQVRKNIGIWKTLNEVGAN